MMKDRALTLFGIAALVFALTLSSTLIGETTPNAVPADKAIAFIDLFKVINASKSLTGVKMEIQEAVRAGEEELGKAQKELETKANELMIYSKDSKEYRDGKSEVERMEFTLKQRERDLVQESEIRWRNALLGQYETIRGIVKSYAMERGISAVLTNNIDMDKIKNGRPEEIDKGISLIDVVWHDEQLDISNAIITIINGS